jgi:hypothetical protein
MRARLCRQSHIGAKPSRASLAKNLRVFGPWTMPQKVAWFSVVCNRRLFIYRVGTISRAESNLSPASECRPRSNVAKTPLRWFAKANRYASVSCR